MFRNLKKKCAGITAILLCCICPCASFAQATGYVSFPDSVNYTGFSRMIHTSDGGFISLSISGPGQVYHEVIKWNANFNVQWSQQFDNTAIFLWNGVIETNDGNFIAMGTNQNNINSTLCIKMNPAGAILWQQEYHIGSNSLTSFVLSKAAGIDPGFIFGGGSCGATNYLVRCNAAGTILWQNDYYINGATSVQTIPVIKAEANNYIINGFALFGSDIDAYIMNIDSSGTLHWCNRINEPVLHQVPARCEKMQNGNYIMLCGCNNNPNYTQLLYYFDANGNVTNGIKLTSPAQQEITFGDLAEVSNGRIILNGFINQSPAPVNYLFMELNANGSIAWQKTAGALNPLSQNAMGKTLAKTSNNLYALGGDGYADGKTIAVIDSAGTGFCSAATGAIVSQASAPFTVTPNLVAIVPLSIIATPVSYTSTSAIVSSITLCGTTGIPLALELDLDLKVFPNPANDRITLMAGDKYLDNAVISFRNVLGEKTDAVRVSGSTVDVSGLAAGVYLMEVVVDGTRVVRRVVKE